MAEYRVKTEQKKSELGIHIQKKYTDPKESCIEMESLSYGQCSRDQAFKNSSLSKAYFWKLKKHPSCSTAGIWLYCSLKCLIHK